MTADRRLAVMAHFDHRGDVALHVRHQVSALADAVDELVIVSTADLKDEPRRFLMSVGRLVQRPNTGYDFYSWRTGLDLAGRLEQFDEVVLCNDSFVGPLRPYDQVFGDMATQPIDFWGLTRSLRVAPHLQSYFLVFRPWVVTSRVFSSFWSQMSPLSDRMRVVHEYEVGLSTRLEKAGFTGAPYFAETEDDRRLARRRTAWWWAHRYDRPHLSSQVDAWAGRCRVEWNPALALADRALGSARLPVVKLDTLRYDPMALNAQRLLRLGEEQHAAAFGGVRDHLDETARLYPARHLEVRATTPPALRPLRPLVEYRDAL